MNTIAAGIAAFGVTLGLWFVGEASVAAQPVPWWADSSITTSPITEDSDEWDCRIMGNQVCGPTNGKYPAGRYQDGQLVENWGK